MPTESEKPGSPAGDPPDFPQPEVKEVQSKPAKESTKPRLKDLFRVLSYGSLMDWLLLGFAIFSAAVSGVALPLNIIFFGRLVDGFVAPATRDSKDHETQFTALVDASALLMVFAFLARFIGGFFATLACRTAGTRISARFRRHYFECLLGQAVSVVDKLPPGYATDALGKSANTLQLALSDRLAALMQSITLTIAALGVALSYSWALALAAIPALVILLVVNAVVVKKWLKIEAEISRATGKAMGIAEEAFASIRTIKSLAAERAILKQYGAYVEAVKRAGLKRTPLSALQLSPYYSLMYGSLALLLWLGIELYSRGEIDGVGDIVIVYTNIFSIIGGAAGIVGYMESIVQATASCDALFRVIDAPRAIHGRMYGREVALTQDLRFENVTFAYPSRPHSRVLNRLSLRFPTGKMTALVGSSGSGKSTIVALLERWYELSDINASPTTTKESSVNAKADRAETGHRAATASIISPDISDGVDQPVQNEGAIFIGEQNILSLDRTWWRSNIGLVTQEPFLFNGTIYENVEIGLIGTKWESASDALKRDLVVQACIDAFADGFIRQQPQGYDQPVVEGGINFSGGQRQRLSIARAIVKNPTILILDEATSSIDVHAEHIVQAALRNATKQRTTITIAHRLSTVKAADQIVVLSAGEVIEFGKHDELLKSNGIYAKMVRVQGINNTAEVDGNNNLMERSRGGSEHSSCSDHCSPDADPQPQDETRKWFQILSKGKNTTPPTKDRGFLRTVGRIVWEDRRLNGWLYPITGLATVTCAAIFAIQPYLLSHYIAVFAQPLGSRMEAAGRDWALKLFAMALATLIAYSTLSACINVMSVRTLARCSNEYFGGMLSKDIEWIENREGGRARVVAHLSDDLKQLHASTGVGMSLPLIGVLGLLGCCLIAFASGWRLSILIFFTALPLVVASGYFRMRYDGLLVKMTTEAFVDSSTLAVEAIGAFRIVCALNLEGFLLAKYTNLLKAQARRALSIAIVACIVVALSDSVFLLCAALAVWYGNRLMLERDITARQFYLIYYALLFGGQVVGHFLAAARNLGGGVQAASRILACRSDVATDSSTFCPTRGLSCGIEDGSSNRGLSVEFADIAFTYPDRKLAVHESMNLSIRPGEYVGIAGPSGCGKTTLALLLLRLYNPNSGAIYFDGCDIRNIPYDEHRRLVAFVGQDLTLLEGTVRQNLTLGLPDDCGLDSSELEAACRIADIHDFVASLPYGYDTVLQGVMRTGLSGGQKQRLCIARALLRKPRLLLLDEATSSLDSQCEKNVQVAIEGVAAARNMTIVAITHRIATIQNADRIIVLDKKAQIVEQGSHAELLAAKGAYHELCLAQALA